MSITVEEIKGYVQQDSIRVLGDATEAPLKLSRRGELCVVDFFTQMALEKRGFEMRCGVDEATETGDDPVTTLQAEMCVDAWSGMTLIPCYFVGFLSTATGTVHEIGLKAHGVNSTAGTAIAPNPLWKGSNVASVAVGQLNDAGGVVVADDAVTDTNCLFEWGGSIAAGAYQVCWEYAPLMPAMCAGPVCIYVQVGSTSGGGAAPEYQCALHWIEMPTAVIE